MIRRTVSFGVKSRREIEAGVAPAREALMILPFERGLRCFFLMIFGVIGPKGACVEGMVLLVLKV